MVSRGLLGLAAAGALVLLTTAPASAAGRYDELGTADLTTVVSNAMRLSSGAAVSAADGRTARVNATRNEGGWAFGTAVLATAPHSENLPQGWLFVAKRTSAGWQVALEGAPEFAELAGQAPVVTAEERRLLVTQDGRQPPGVAAGSDFRTGMALPFGVGQTWYMGGGAHGWGGSEQPYSSIDLSGGDQRVLAARAGTAYTMCTGWIRVIHDRGYATDYYHLWNNINVNGAPVGQGSYLGDTGTDVTCGGAANGRHVHFGLRQNNVYVGIAGHNVGKWVPLNGASAYQGPALHGSTVVYPGGGLYNFGALGFTEGVIDGNGGGLVNRRSGPGSGYPVVGTVNDGTTVGVSCSANGTTHSGRWGTTSLWNRLSDGTWVTDALMWTGMSGPINGYC